MTLFKGKKLYGAQNVLANFMARRVDKRSEDLSGTGVVVLDGTESSIINIPSGSGITEITLPLLNDSDGFTYEIFNNSGTDVVITNYGSLTNGKTVVLTLISGAWRKFKSSNASEISFDDTSVNFTAVEIQEALDVLDINSLDMEAILGVFNGDINLGNLDNAVISDGTDVKTAIESIDSNLQEYIDSFISGDWSEPGTPDGYKYLNYTFAVHGQEKPVVEILESVGSEYKITEIDKVSISDSNDVSLRIPSFLGFDGKVVISRLNLPSAAQSYQISFFSIYESGESNNIEVWNDSSNSEVGNNDYFFFQDSTGEYYSGHSDSYDHSSLKLTKISLSGTEQYTREFVFQGHGDIEARDSWLYNQSGDKLIVGGTYFSSDTGTEKPIIMSVSLSGSSLNRVFNEGSSIDGNSFRSIVQSQNGNICAFSSSSQIGRNVYGEVINSNTRWISSYIFDSNFDILYSRMFRCDFGYNGGTDTVVKDSVITPSGDIIIYGCGAKYFSDSFYFGDGFIFGHMRTGIITKLNQSNAEVSGNICIYNDYYSSSDFLLDSSYGVDILKVLPDDQSNLLYVLYSYGSNIGIISINGDTFSSSSGDWTNFGLVYTTEISIAGFIDADFSDGELFIYLESDTSGDDIVIKLNTSTSTFTASRIRIDRISDIIPTGDYSRTNRRSMIVKNGSIYLYGSVMMNDDNSRVYTIQLDTDTLSDQNGGLWTTDSKKINSFYSNFIVSDNGDVITQSVYSNKLSVIAKIGDILDANVLVATGTSVSSVDNTIDIRVSNFTPEYSDTSITDSSPSVSETSTLNTWSPIP